MSEPACSVVVPLFNKETHIEACLASLSRQSLRQIEIICVDDCSTDGSLAVATSFSLRDPRVRVLCHSPHKGAGLTRNRGLLSARGKYVQFTDADDVLPPDALEMLYGLAESHQLEVVRGGISSFSQDDLATLRTVDCPPLRHRIRFEDEPHLWIPWWHTTYLFRRAFLLHNRLNYPRLADGEDPIFVAKALVAARYVSMIPNVVYYYRQHGGGAPRNVWHFLRHLEEVHRIFLAREPRAWFEGYGPFARHILHSNYLPKYRLSAEDKSSIRARIDGLLQREEHKEQAVNRAFTQTPLEAGELR